MAQQVSESPESIAKAKNTQVSTGNSSVNAVSDRFSIHTRRLVRWNLKSGTQSSSARVESTGSKQEGHVTQDQATQNHSANENFTQSRMKVSDLLNASSSVIYPHEGDAMFEPRQDDARPFSPFIQNHLSNVRSVEENMTNSIALAQVWTIEGEFRKATAPIVSHDSNYSNIGRSTNNARNVDTFVQAETIGYEVPRVSYLTSAGVTERLQDNENSEMTRATVETDLEESLGSFFSDIGSVVHVDNLGIKKESDGYNSRSMNPLV
jgi:hypothetical protein